MLRQEKDGVHWLEYELLAEFPHVKHGVFLRHGGHSQGEYASLNLSYFVGDDAACVKGNFDKVMSIMGVKKIVYGEQNHGKTISLVTSDTKEILCGDGLATATWNLGLLICHADCQAAIMYDTENKAVVNVHCGWKGNVQNIYGSAVAFMQKFFRTKPQNLLVCISPSLAPHSAEFINYRKELPENFWEFQVKPYYFDLWAISEMQLVQSGVLKHHIQIAGIDTLNNPQDYYSYRYQKVRGCHGTFVSLNP